MASTCRLFYCRLLVAAWCLCWLPVLSASSRSRTVVELNYDFQEEQPIGSFVGDVKRDANLTSLYEPSVVEQLRFTFMRQYSTRLFDVDATTGVVRSIARVDREQLCPRGVDVCVVRIDVAVRPVDHFMIVRLTVNVVDLNDHTPAFPDRQLTIEVLESATAATTIPLPLAVDPDSPPLSVTEYRVAKSTGADVFRLRHDKGAAGAFDALRIELISGLDRELNGVYRITIVAVDGGSPPLTGSTELTVKVVDVNDNSPRFEHSDYDVTVPEDVAPGTTLLRVAAVDPDDGLNGRIIYELSPQAPGLTGDSNRLPFAVDNVTGAVVVQTSLDRDRGPSRYQFVVSARDMGPDAVATTCIVVVQLTDVNDNAPDIVIDSLLDGQAETAWPPSSAEIARVTENAREGTFVAHVTVIDLDQGAAGRFNCSLANTDDEDDGVNVSDFFRLNQFDDSEFQLVTSGDANIDRERRADFRLSIICVDYGQPSLRSHQEVRVVVADVNDCSPTFSRDVYKAEIIENNYVGASLIVVTAYDADRGDNARLTYSVVGPQSGDFRVDPTTGEITALTSFDREMMSTTSFIVVARDAGSPPLSGSATVLVSVVDVNDNSPEFDVVDGEEFLFRVDENEPAGTFVGQVSALDPDSEGEGNVSYAINSDAWSSSDIDPDSIHGLFELGQFTGVLVTRRPLDAELTDTYRFQVLAVDSGVPPRSSIVSVVVIVGDVNDNRPRFVFPSSTSGNVVYIPPNSVPRGYVIVAVNAADPDVAPSSSIIYGLTDDSRCFEIDRVSGIISVADESQLIEKTDGWTFSLTVTATDQGGLQTSEILYVVVNSSASTDMLFSGSDRWEAFTVDRRHVLIVVCIVAVCGVLVVGLVVVIASVRGRQRRLADKRRSRSYNCRAAACMRLQQDSAAAGPRYLPPANAWSSNDASQSLLLVRQINEVDREGVRNGQPLMKCYSNDRSVDSSQLNGSRTVLKSSPNCNRKVFVER